MTKSATIIGAGPSGLMAAQKLAENGVRVAIYERKKSPARKFLLAGRGGLNLTHSENSNLFLKQYREAEDFMRPLYEEFTSSQLRDWTFNLGEETFIGSSGRIFPLSFKASPLLRAILRRLEQLGVEFHMQKEWKGWQSDKLLFEDIDGTAELVKSDATLLALGGASWPHLGSDGGWTPILKNKDITLSPFQPANCGFHVQWSEVFKIKFSGQALKTIALKFQDKVIPGEIMIDKSGIEGGAIYALSADLRKSLVSSPVTLYLDLKPGLSQDKILDRLEKRPRQRQSFSTYLEKSLGLPPLAIGLLREFDMNVQAYTNKKLSELIKSVPVALTSPFSIERAISSAGGISLDEIDKNMMLKKIPGVFAAGEMLDWEAPTGGYLLQGCFSSAVKASQGIMAYFSRGDV